MALAIEKQFLGGQVTANYHRIRTLPWVQNHLNASEVQTFWVSIDGYANSEAFKVNNLPPLGSVDVSILASKQDILNYSGNFWQFLYSKIVMLPEFSGATEAF